MLHLYIFILQLGVEPICVYRSLSGCWVFSSIRVSTFLSSFLSGLSWFTFLPEYFLVCFLFLVFQFYFLYPLAVFYGVGFAHEHK